MIHRCDGVWDCRGGEDEMSCDNFCRGGRFTCRNRKDCVEHNQYCDGRSDCPDGSDELPDCVCNRAGQFACKTPAGSPQCVARMSVCDGKDDCDDGSDESICGRHTSEATVIMRLLGGESNLTASYSTEPYLVETSTKIADKENVNFRTQYDNESTQNAKTATSTRRQHNKKRPIIPNGQAKRSTPAPIFDVHVYPARQEVLAGHDVVLQCRDEGDARAEVHWTRHKGTSLPERAIQTMGRLDIPEIRLEEAGIYICRAKGHHPKSKGSQMTARVKVLPRP